ncbi:oxidoreductase [Pseudogemmobacter bohemicus]|uniref:oxidoreductase n=1 Tax=Pseudogemmobacter bohemicus TaxID=2250708 RepID=UPI000DD30CD6|nr:oxidoreductase [Pseudogemmobacter bohemicus]
MTVRDNSVWFITGASTGFGAIFARQALEAGHRVVATARDPGALAALAERGGERVLTLALDVTDDAARRAAVAAAEARFGAIDVLVNNAGFGYLAAQEEGQDAEIRQVFEVNVFALAALTRLVLPGQRARGYGHIVNISSVAGLAAKPGVGYYAATKFAVEALSEALAEEVAEFGIRVLLVEPGPFRTDFAGRSILAAPQIADYHGRVAHQRPASIRAGSGQEDGDPELAVRLVLAQLARDEAPLRLALGAIAVDRALEKLEPLVAELKAQRALSVAADRKAEGVA